MMPVETPPSSFIPGGQKCMSFYVTEPSQGGSLRIRNKTRKAPTTTTTPLRTPGLESQHAQVKSPLELTVLVEKIGFLAGLLVICTAALSQLMVAAGYPGCGPQWTHPAVIDPRLNPPFISVWGKIRARWGKASASFSVFFLWRVLVCRMVGVGEDSCLASFGVIFL